MTGQRTSSPASTGGAGNFFEQHVAAYWLAHLLVCGIPPILLKTIVTEVHFQTKHLGWCTDDFLVVCECRGGTVRKLAGQVKRNITISRADDDFKSAIEGFWNDFKSPDCFSRTNDRLVLVTLHGTDSLFKHFMGLLNCARAARNASEFEHRLTTKGFISKKAVNYFDVLFEIIADIKGNGVERADVWSFLRLFYVQSLDLFTDTRQTEADIKNLLASTVTDKEEDALAAVDQSWNTLLDVASDAMSRARSIRRADLPTELLHRHESMGAKEQRILKNLRDHTTPVLRGIRSTIGNDFHLERATLVQNVLSEFETAQVVLLSGPAGSGKSAIGKDIVTFLMQDHFVFGFRAEEFAQPHIDATLYTSQILTKAETLFAILSTQGHKFVLIESVERLLEKSTRDAFSDLITIVAADHNMRMVLTCRDYSVEQVRASFLQPAAINPAVVNVPPLDDMELAEVEKALPELSYPLANRPLRDILRNPYYLDKSLEINWSIDRPVPESEREFRLLFWGQIVCKTDGAPAGMARCREEVFQKIAVRRARALSSHVKCNDLNPDAVAALKQDSLIVSSDKNPLLVATSHDVLEDWAILQWLEEQYLIKEGAFRVLSTVLGTHPAIRRSYRKWIAEMIDHDPDAADRLFRDAIYETGIIAQFRDDTLISLLRAHSSPEFLKRHEIQLLANDNAILKRVIHLLRVACVTTSDLLVNTGAQGSIFNVPDGPAWETVLRLVYRNIDSFTPEDGTLLLGLIEDAVSNVSWKAPEIEGAEYVSGIGHRLLEGVDNYRNDSRERVLKVIAKIPKADSDRFEAILRGTERAGQRLDNLTEKLRELIFSSMVGMPAARDLPDLVIAVATDYLLTSEDDLQREYFSLRSHDLESYFGIKERLQHHFFPASAFRGPWISLLQYHPCQTLDFFIHIFNYSADWYANPRFQFQIEPAGEIELTFADGTTRSQWGNPRLWKMYRGTSVGPDVLQSLLMALERWLLELAKQDSCQLDFVLLDILRRSDSAALSAVVAGVATAYPHLSGKALLVLLTAPDYMMFDRIRMVDESQAPTLTGMIPQIQMENKIYEEERKEANELPHRRRDLEVAIANLQLGPYASRVHTILDEHLNALPPSLEQNESDRLWRLAIHRMDLRQYTDEDTNDPESSGTDVPGGESAKRYIKLYPKTLESDLQAMVDESAAESGAMKVRFDVQMWGHQIFEKKNGNYDPSHWREKLNKARTMCREAKQGDGSQHASGIIAAVCVRDHWDDMAVDERDWSVDVVCSEVMRNSDEWDKYERIQRYPMAADRPCASVTALLLCKLLTGHQNQRVRMAFTAAITHPNEEVRRYTTWGINEDFWTKNGTLAMRCVNAIATEATIIDETRKIKQTKPYEERYLFEDIAAEVANTIRARFWQEGGIADDAHIVMNTSTQFGAEASARMLTILGNAPNEPFAIDAFVRAGQMLVDWWDTAVETHGEDRNFNTEAAVSNCLQRFLMKTTRMAALQVLCPILEAINHHPREIYFIVHGLTMIEDNSPNTDQYWYLWKLFADGVRRATWVARLDNRQFGSEMISALLLNLCWQDDVRHWRSLEGYADQVHNLFESLPPSSTVLDYYVLFLYHIGQQSLPDAFVRIAKSLDRGDKQAMLRISNTVFLLEVLLQRHVYGRPLELKQNSIVRSAVFSLLDILIENGSSAAFKMRDDFATPLPST